MTKKDTTGRQESNNNFFTGLFSWKLTNFELRHQVTNYNRLKLGESPRVISTVLIIVASILTFILIPEDGWIEATLALILAYFVNRGRVWAIILMMILWTIGRIAGLVLNTLNFNPLGLMTNIFFWLFFMKYFYQAYQVEKERRSQ